MVLILASRRTLIEPDPLMFKPPRPSPFQSALDDMDTRAKALSTFLFRLAVTKLACCCDQLATGRRHRKASSCRARKHRRGKSLGRMIRQKSARGRAVDEAPWSFIDEPCDRSRKDEGIGTIDRE